MTLFSIDQYWFLYVLILLVLVLTLAIDLGNSKKKMSYRVALIRITLYIAMGLGLGGGIYLYALSEFGALAAQRLAVEYLAGYIIELSLSVDNLFVFIVIFRFFQITAINQRIILIYGILGAVILRGIFILIGVQLIQVAFMEIVFGLFLIFTGIIFLRKKDEKDDLSKNPIYNVLRKYIPLTPEQPIGKFLIKKGKKWLGTPMLIALLMVEFSDLIFAVDSVPAILAISREPFIVFSSNMMALLGLRSLFAVVNHLLEKLHYLKQGLSAILIFVGLKMAWLDNFFPGHFPATLSISVILGILAISVLASLYRVRRTQM